MKISPDVIETVAKMIVDSEDLHGFGETIKWRSTSETVRQDARDRAARAIRNAAVFYGQEIPATSAAAAELFQRVLRDKFPKKSRQQL